MHLMAEIVAINGFSPERLVDAENMVSNLDVNALVFRGMALSVHDKMLKLHKQFYSLNESNKFTNDEEMIGLLVEMGWDIPSLGNQTPEGPVWPIDAVPTTTIELVPPGGGIDWHNDVSRGKEANQICLPLGIGVSINLVSPALFKVASVVQPLALNYRLSQHQIDELVEGASVKFTDPELESALESVLYPGDVIMWRQPVAHQVWVYEEDPDNLRRAIIFLEEDVATAS